MLLSQGPHTISRAYQLPSTTPSVDLVVVEKLNEGIYVHSVCWQMVGLLKYSRAKQLVRAEKEAEEFNRQIDTLLQQKREKKAVSDKREEQQKVQARPQKQSGSEECAEVENATAGEGKDAIC